MRQWISPVTIGAALLGLGAGAASPAQTIVSAIYDLDQERSDDAFQAIDSATAALSAAQRPLARMRLRKSVAVGQIRISLAGRQLGIGYDAKAPIIVRIGEEPVRWQLIEELVFDVSAVADGDAVSVRFRGDDSDRTVIYRNVGETLVERNSIISPLLPTPIRFTHVYNRRN